MLMKHTFLFRLAAFGFSTSILLLAVTAPAVMVFGTPDTLKKSLRDSGAYDAASRQLAEKAGDAATSRQDLPIDKESVSQAAAETFSPKTIETNAEKVIEGTYNWLDGKTATPEFNVDLQPYVNNFTQTLNDRLVQQAQVLPVCSPEQLRQVDPNNIDVFKLQCLPPGVTLDMVKGQISAETAKSSQEFLENPNITADTLPKNSEGQTVAEQASNLPTIYQWLKKTPMIFGFLALLFAVAVTLLAMPEWRASIRKLGRSLLVTGLVLLVLTGLVRLLFTYLTRPGGLGEKLAGDELKDVALAFATSLERAYDSKLLLFGASYAIAGLFALIVLRFLKSSARTEAITPAVPTAATPSLASSTVVNPASRDDRPSDRSSTGGTASSSSDSGGPSAGNSSNG